jgi:hypothetical protein
MRKSGATDLQPWKPDHEHHDERPGAIDA